MHPTTIYSSFFSSGLHNQNATPLIDSARTLDLDLDLEFSKTETESNTSTLGGESHCGSDSNYSPSRASSPIPIPFQSDNGMDVDLLSVSAPATTTYSGDRAWGRRSVTPTPDSASRQTTPVPHRIQTSQRLRTRRSKSSLTQSLTSPKAIHAIKSPIRAASNAFTFQKQVHQHHIRLNPNAGNEHDLQSGTPSLAIRPRRLFSFARRRLPSTPIPAPGPPPMMPLPALPLQEIPSLSPSPLEDSKQHNLLSAFKSGEMPFGRRRGLSKSSLAADEHRINEVEEMKEN